MTYVSLAKHGKKKKTGHRASPRNTVVPGYNEMTHVKRMAEVQTFRNDLRRAEMRRNHVLELGNIQSALFGRLSPGVQHRLHNRRDEVEALFLETLK